MEINWGSLKNRLSDGDLFDRTRNKLTLQYSSVLIAFLSLFVIIVYVLLYVFIWNDQRTGLNELADSEIRTLQKWADQDSDPNRRPPRSIEDAFSISTDQSFYYLIAENGNIQLGDEIQPELRNQVIEAIAKGHFRGRGIEKVTLQTFDKPSTDDLGRPKLGRMPSFLFRTVSCYGMGHGSAPYM